MVTVEVELGPVERQRSLVVLGDVDLPDGAERHVGDRLELVDEGGFRYSAVVDSVASARYGQSYRVSFTDGGAR
jgi:hypothetical protein